MDEKYQKLYGFIKSLDKVILAFSGGVDSSLLLRVAKDALGENVKAVTLVSPYIPKWEIDEARELSSSLGIKHEFIEMDIIDDIKNNPVDRCYLCKKAIFKKIVEMAKNQGYKYVIDGSNFDDTKDYRPGLKALEELDVVSPLMICEMTKDDIRLMSKALGLTTWNKPAYACLLTRLPHDEPISIETLNRIEQAETFLIDLGIKAVRVRVHGDLARVEVDPNFRSYLFNEALLDEISRVLKSLGFKYVTLDMAGYRMGSFNPIH